MYFLGTVVNPYLSQFSGVCGTTVPTLAEIVRIYVAVQSIVIVQWHNYEGSSLLLEIETLVYFMVRPEFILRFVIFISYCTSFHPCTQILLEYHSNKNRIQQVNLFCNWALEPLNQYNDGPVSSNTVELIRSFSVGAK